MSDQTQITVLLPPTGGSGRLDAAPVDSSALAAVGESLGSNTVQLGPPSTLAIAFTLAATDVGADGTAQSVTIVLPPLPQPDPAVGYACWLQAITRSDGSFLGFIPVIGEPDLASGGLLVQLPLSGTTTSVGITLLPATIMYSYVQNFAADTHLFSGPTDDARDFGPAAEQFTTFTVMGPPVNGRLFVYNPAADAYGWIDAVGVGPV